MKIEWRTCFKITVSAFMLYLCIHYWKNAAALLATLFSAAAPLLLGCVIAYMVNILMSFYEKRFFAKSKGAFMILTVSPVKAIIFLIFIVVLQQLEGNLIYPRVVGSSLGLPAIWVLAAVTVGGGIMGILGMLLGVPLAAAAYRLLREDVRNGSEKGAGLE
ncbi:MAG: AI-2E family transporter [Clostridia bacterium]|nr:AI-2E family transporter [Clostridia bacterium]